MAFENITENTWSPTGDYGTAFKEELNSYKSNINDEIDNLKKVQSKIDTHITNSELCEDSINAIDTCLRRLQLISEELDDTINSLEYL